MAVQPQFLAYVLEQLAGVGSLRPNRMFGAVGLYSDGLFFGLVDDDTLYFKTDESNIEVYRARNMPKFMPFPDRPEGEFGYREVPADVIEDAETLVEWARKSVAVAARAQAAKGSRKPRGKKPKTERKTPAQKTPAQKVPAQKVPAQKVPARKKLARKKSARRR